MIEIVNGVASKILLEKAGLFDYIIDMSLFLNVGKIKNLEITNVRSVCNYNVEVKEKIDLLKEKLKSFNKVRIWYSSIDSEEYCFFLFLVCLISKYDVEISVIDVGKNKLWSVACLNENEIKGVLSLDKVLNLEDKEFFSNKWKQLVYGNKDLRLIENEVKSFDYDYLDNKILELLSKYKGIEKDKFIALCIVNELCLIHGYILFNYRILEMIKENKIKSINGKISL